MFLTMLLIGLQVVGGILYANLLEWIIHKYVLHRTGKNKKSYFYFHWYVHHQAARKNNFIDPEYNEYFWKKGLHRKREIVGLFLLGVVHAWIMFVLPWMGASAICWIFVYYFVHKWSHKNPSWGRKWLSWHYDHHMGIDQNKNWCVTLPIWDYVFRTRVKYNYDEKGKIVKSKKRTAVTG
jgi:hypothetical protein